MFLETAALSHGPPRQEPMNARGDERSVIDRHLVLTDTHREGLADQSQGRRIEVLTIDHEPLGVDGAVHDLGAVERPLRQRQQKRPFLGVAIQRACPGRTMDTHVGDLGQPPDRGLVQMLQRTEAPAIE